MDMLTDIGHHPGPKLTEKEKKTPEEPTGEVKSALEDIFALVPLPIAVIDPDTGRFIAVNRKLCELFQYEKNEVIGRTAVEMGVWAQGDEKRFLNALHTVNEISAMEIALKAKEGSASNILLYSKVISDEDNFLALTTFVEIKLKRQLEYQRYHERKLRKTLKTLAGGLAHLINNALQVIMGNVDCLLFYPKNRRKSAENLLQIRDSSNKIEHIIQQLLAFSQSGITDIQSVALGYFVRSVLVEIRDLIKPEIVIETNFPDDIFSVVADERQLKMLITAILVNASDAIGGAGSIRITCKNEIITDKVVVDHQNLYPGAYAHLIIEDNGVGMNKNTMARIFEPFFTTKFQGRGMNMAATYGIVRSHGGCITVESQWGQGTRVHVYLPAMTAQA